MTSEKRAIEQSDTPVLLPTRVLSAVIVPFLVAAWWILYLRPDHTEDLFAWPIRPQITAMTLGAIYLGGAYFFVRAVAARAWERIALGFPPVAGFATLMGIATILHWDRFTSGHVAFLAWAVLYFSTPVLVLGVWLANRRVRVSSPDPDEVVLSARARFTAGAIGGVAVVVALALFAWPERLLEVWPWMLTPLTARVMAAIFFLGSVGIGIALDPRWRAVRLPVQVFWVMIALVTTATLVSWQDVDPGNALTWVFGAGLAAVFAASLVLYRTMERRPVVT